jgi:hypothetical protein
LLPFFVDFAVWAADMNELGGLAMTAPVMKHSALKCQYVSLLVEISHSLQDSA